MKNVTFFIISFIAGMILSQIAQWLNITKFTFEWCTFILLFSVISVVILTYIDKSLKNRKEKTEK